MFWKYAKGGLRVPEGGFTPKFNTPTSEGPRPCEVDDRICWFHRFVDEDKVLLKVKTFMHEGDAQEFRKSLDQAGIVPPCCDIEVISETRALIEWPDGSLSTVAVERVQFLDRGDDRMG